MTPRIVHHALCRPKANRRGVSPGAAPAEGWAAGSWGLGDRLVARALCLCLASPSRRYILQMFDCSAWPEAFQMDVCPPLGHTCSCCLWFHSHAAELGARLADLHLENQKLGEALRKRAGTVGMGLCLSGAC